MMAVTQQARNRRLMYMLRVLMQSEYFTEEAMRVRCFDLYEAHFGDNADKEVAFEDLQKAMQERFLNGMDECFDYTEIDCNPDYDDIETEERVDEDKYFDQESSNGQCTDTGVNDF
jgi:hypothetical protein